MTPQKALTVTISDTELHDLVGQLPIPVPWDIEAFADNLARRQGRPIRLVPVNTTKLKNSPCGLWFITATEDFILYEAGTSHHHIEQIICHEIGHMVLGHANQCDTQTRLTQLHLDLCRETLPDFNPAHIQRVFGREHFVAEQEREAEMFAHLVLLAAEAGAKESTMRRAFFGSL